MRKLGLLSIISAILLSGCTYATQTLALCEARMPATVRPDEDLVLLKVDDRMVKVKSYKETGTEFYKVAISPGKHKIVACLPELDEGSIFFLDISVVGGKEYRIRYQIGNRVSRLSNKWYVDVWVEDEATREVVSSIIKNI